MAGVRRVAVVASVAAWVYSWYLLRGVRFEYAGGDIGDMPPWALVLLGGGTLLTLGAAAAGLMKAPAWPWLAIAAGVVLAASVVGGQFAVMNSALGVLTSGTRGASPADALRAAIRSRSPLHLALVAALPTVLVLAGVTGVFRRGEAPEA